jgi:hypothetical protein
MSNSVVRAACVVVMVGGAALAACGGGDYLPSPSKGDGSAPERNVSDADLVGDMAADAAGGDGTAADSNLPAAKITVTISSPKTDAVVAALLRFTPEVEVRIESMVARAEDALREVAAEVVERQQQTVAVAAKLNQVGLEALPESNVLIYRFADTPLALAAAASGNYNLVITARTNGGREVKAELPFQIDAGPTIRVDAPGKDKAYRGSSPIDVTISDDYFGPVSDVSMKVGQHAVTFTGPGGAGGRQYTATLDFNGFMPALEGEQILTVRAKNRNGTEAVVTRKFVSDSKGPAITAATPRDGDLAGNVITIAAEVTDPAGVLSSSVVAVFANGPGTEYTVPLNPPPPGAERPSFSALFDTRLLPFGQNALYPTLSFRASDNLGNESLLTNVIWLDNHPPLAEIDPPDIRLRTPMGCSWWFDPVGPDVVDDGDIVPQISDLRARIQDQGNEPLSGNPNYIPISGIDVAQLLVLDDISQPLVVNTNPVERGNRKADTNCDAVNPLLIPTTRPMTSKDALVITMFPVAPVGTADYTKITAAPPAFQSILVGDDLTCAGFIAGRTTDPTCNATWNLAKARWKIWKDNELMLVEPHSHVLPLYIGYAGTQAAIWTIPKQEAGLNNPLCGGTQFDALANFVNDGWACVAVFASDKLGNKQVSRPLRMCVDKDSDGKECPHREIARVLNGSPMTVETVADHGYATGDKVRVSGVAPLVAVVNKLWTITVTGPRSFTMDGSEGEPGFGYGGWTRPARSPSRPTEFIPGHAVRMSDVPDCTGTQTAEPPMTMVDHTACVPWRTYAPFEERTTN